MPCEHGACLAYDCRAQRRGREHFDVLAETQQLASGMVDAFHWKLRLDPAVRPRVAGGGRAFPARA